MSICRKYQILTYVVLPVFAFLSYTPPTTASPLQEIIDSKDFKRMQKKANPRGSHYSKKWFQLGSSYASVFLDQQGGVLLLDWLGLSSTGLTLGELNSRRHQEYVLAERSLLTKDIKKLTVRVLVPHPKYKDAASLKLIQVFADLEPPNLKILFSEEFTLGETKGTLFHVETGACSLVIKGSRGSVVLLGSPSCQQKEELIALAHKLDFSRFNERLNS